MSPQVPRGYRSVLAAGEKADVRVPTPRVRDPFDKALVADASAFFDRLPMAGTDAGANTLMAGQGKRGTPLA